MRATHTSTPRFAAAIACLALASRPALARAEPEYYPGSWQLTQYWIATERASTPEPRAHRATPVHARDGRVLAWCGRGFYADLCMEGTGRTWDNRLLNWDARVEGRACFVDVDQDSYPWGMGVAGYALVPFRSLAVDRRVVPIGHTVEIPDLAGLPLPDGTLHDGCFVATDSGGAINGHHFDLFLPSSAAWRELGRAGLLPERVRGVVVDAPRCAYAAQYAFVPLPGDPPIATSRQVVPAAAR